MTDISPFHPTLLIIAGIVFVIGVVIGIHKYIHAIVDPTTIKATQNEKEVNRISSESKAEFARQSERWTELRTTLETMKEKLFEITISQTEVKTALFGMDGRNGIRGQLAELRDDVRELRNRISEIEKLDSV